MGKNDSKLDCEWRDILSVSFRYIICLPVYIYQFFIKPVLPPCCRFQPSCSNYAIESLRNHSFFNAVKLILIRLSRCHPWHEGGSDPVPNKRETHGY